MLQTVVARLILVRPEIEWDRLEQIEGILKQTWPEASVLVGGLGSALPLSVAEIRAGGAAAPDEIREFVVRGHVTATRSPGGLVSEHQPPDCTGVMFLFFPAEPDPAEMQRIAGMLNRVWPGSVSYGAARRSDLPPDQTTDDKLMEFLIEIEPRE